MQFTPIKDDRVQIYLLFYRPARDDPFQNRLVAYFDSPFCHVEMAFPEKYGTEPWEKEVLGSSIYQGDVIFFKSKTYQREGYFSYAIEVSRAQCLKIKNYCRLQSEKGVPFSKVAMYSAYLPVQLFNIDGSFCSKHVTMALQEGEVEEVMHLNPCLVTPSSLYKILLVNSARRPIVQVVPSKMAPPCPDDDSNDFLTTTQDTSITIRNQNQHLCAKMAEDLISTFKNEKGKGTISYNNNNNNNNNESNHHYYHKHQYGTPSMMITPRPSDTQICIAEVQQNISNIFIKDFLCNSNAGKPNLNLTLSC